jgi:peptidoglycan/LPS O-acetylase OafA/YrhL
MTEITACLGFPLRPFGQDLGVSTLVTTETRPVVVTPAAPARAKAFRPDIEGLRAVAVLLVVAFHAGLGVLSGGYVGVDVFFVISGFLISGLLIEEQRLTGGISLSGFYARRIRRLLPLGSLVLLTTAAVSAVVVPALDRPGVAGDTTAAALWWANWHFAGNATNYMSSVELSPVLHFWSLSVEEQFYVAWPLLILLVTWGAGAFSWRVQRARLALALVTLAVVSFALSVHLGAASQAYFGLHTRAWELAAGGLLAMAVPLVRRAPRIAAVLAGWAGLVAIGVAAVVFDRTTVFPGSAAALPVAGSALLLAAGVRTQAGASRLLGSPAMTYIGKISYGWYLWHWPCLVLARIAWGSPTVDPGVESSTAPRPLVAVAAVLVSFGLAALTYRYVEQPTRTSRALSASRPLTFALAAALLVTSVGGSQLLLRGSVQHSLLVAGGTQTVSAARADKGLPKACYLEHGSDADPSCVFGDKSGDRVVVLVGDSHAAHWFPAMEAIAKRRHWQLWFWARAACAAADIKEFNPTINQVFTECSTWRTNVLSRVAALPHVDLVVVGSRYSYSGWITDGNGDQPGGSAAAALWAQGSSETVKTLAESAHRVVLLREIPSPGKDVPACLSKHLDAPQDCSFSRSRRIGPALYAAEQQVLSAEGLANYVDMSRVVCPADPCSVISPQGAIVFRDTHHLTARFAREISPELERRLLPVLSS